MDNGQTVAQDPCFLTAASSQRQAIRSYYDVFWSYVDILPGNGSKVETIFCISSTFKLLSGQSMLAIERLLMVDQVHGGARYANGNVWRIAISWLAKLDFDLLFNVAGRYLLLTFRDFLLQTSLSTSKIVFTPLADCCELLFSLLSIPVRFHFKPQRTSN